MEKLVVNGGRKLSGNVTVSGSKNVALKALVAACLTDEEVTIERVPLISDLIVMKEIIEEFGGDVALNGHTVTVRMLSFRKNKVALDKAALVRTSSMFFAPLLARCKAAVIPNPGGCRIGARPIDRMVDGLSSMGGKVSYSRSDGYFHAKSNRLRGTTYRFEKNTHTGTETMILAAVLAEGKTVLQNAAEEPEVDELIVLLAGMGARIERKAKREIVVEGVDRLHGTSFTIGPDRNEIVTFAIAAIVTGGDVLVKGAQQKDLAIFLEKLEEAGAGIEEQRGGIRFFSQGRLRAVDVITAPAPSFMTDWQGPWAVLMTQAEGSSTIHETVYENRFGYVEGLQRMGARITFFDPTVSNPSELYNFNLSDDKDTNSHAIRINGSVHLHNAVVTISDLRAGATLVLGALAAKGQSIIFGLEHLDRGYEQFESRLGHLGASLTRVTEE